MKKTVTLRIAAPVWDRWQAYHLAPAKTVESLSYVFATVDDSGDTLRILVPANAPLIEFGPDCFERQAAGNVRLYRDVLRGLLIRFAQSHHNALINVHDHWFSAHPSFSPVDDADDRTFDRYLRESLEPALATIAGAVVRPIWNLAFVLGQKGAAMRIVDTRRRNLFAPITHLTVTGDRHRTVALEAKTSVPASPEGRLSRHRDFIAPEHQAALRSLHVALVGCGGTGSILAETLGRLGVGSLTLIDGDRLDETNLNRWQGAEPWMVGKSKTHLLARRLKRMCPRLRIQALDRSVFDPDAELALRQADVLFGAVDADAPRLFLNRLALQQLVPYFDVGVAVMPDDGSVDFRTRFFAVYPGRSACIECTTFALYDDEDALLAFLDAATAAARRQAGYVSGQPEAVTPSVYALNQRATGLAVTEFLNWICGWQPAATLVTESWLQGRLWRADRANFPEGPNPACPVCGYLAGSGASEPPPRPAGFAATSVPPAIKEFDDADQETGTD
jgi:ThiF family